MEPPLHGTTAPDHTPVRDAFAALLAGGAETGAALTISRHGTVVVDLYGGWRDAARTAPWAPDTLVNVFSVAKPVAALCVLLLVDRGRLGLDDPVARHWPEFAAAGKDAVTVRQVLAHTAGLPAFPVPRGADAYADWDLLAGDLAAAAPEWTPGSVAAEHALTYGHLAGELVRRVDGRSLGRFLAEEIAAPWRLDLAVGVPVADHGRCAELEYADPEWPARMLGTPGSLRERALGNPAGALDLAMLNGGAWRSAEVPAVNLHTTAAAVARLYAGLLAGGTLDGVRLLDPATVAELVRPQYTGPDLLLQREVTWTLGMQLDDDGSWGMGGIGGNLGYADPAPGYAVAYTTRRLGDFDRVDTVLAALP